MRKQRRVNKTFGEQLSCVQLPTDQHRGSLGRIGRPAIRKGAGESRGGELISVLSAVRTAKPNDIVVFLAEKRKRKGVAFFNDGVGEALRPNKADRHGLVPKHAATAPRSRHGVCFSVGCRADQHFIFSDTVKDRVKVLWGMWKKRVHGSHSCSVSKLKEGGFDRRSRGKLREKSIACRCLTLIGYEGRRQNMKYFLEKISKTLDKGKRIEYNIMVIV